MASISLRPINDLLSEQFFVPSYQRGFRWTKQQVVDLLNDIWEFQAKAEKKDRFYCLQPVVVKRRTDGTWELVDGQQRLTTILLILKFKEALVSELGKKAFTLQFETRPKSEEFLRNIELEKQELNIDYFHICQALNAIKDWSGTDKSKYLKLLQCLTNDESGVNVRVIWYELPESSDPVDAFTRLNVGKIPLTNSELIRALFLRSRNFGADSKHLQQLKIAQEWDAIEKALQSDEMWYFLTDGAKSSSNRIEFIFEQIALPSHEPAVDDPFATFHFFHNTLGSPDATAEGEWLKVKQTFMTLEEWFNDRILFHLVGYLIHDNYRLATLREEARGITKSEFRRFLRHVIFERLIEGGIPSTESVDAYKARIGDRICELEYDTHRKRIQSILLLFNIATILLNSESSLRFPFHHFKKRKWDIEHVRSVKSDKPTEEPQCHSWLEHFATHMGDVTEGRDLCTRARELLGSRSFEIDKFDSLYNDVLAAFQESTDTESDNGIGNLALLDSNTNRSYKNAVFPVKRSRILALDRIGTFVPLCTKSVFLKCYSSEIGKMMFWSNDDRNGYRDHIVNSLSNFFALDVLK